jgi:hypothetical protein
VTVGESQVCGFCWMGGSCSTHGEIGSTLAGSGYCVKWRTYERGNMKLRVP